MTYSPGTKLCYSECSECCTVLTDGNVMITKGLSSGNVIKLADWLILANGKEMKEELAKAKKPSIFNIPVTLSPSLCAFLDIPSGSSDTRSNVSKAVIKYIKDNNLMKGHEITVTGKLTYIIADSKIYLFSLNSCLSKHYNKNHIGPVSVPTRGGWSSDYKPMIKEGLPCTGGGHSGSYQGTYVNGILMC